MATSTPPVIPGTQGWAKTQIPAYNALIAKKQDQRNVDKQFQNQAADDVANQNSALAATHAGIDAGLNKQAETDLKSAYLANPPQLSAATDSFGTKVGQQLQGIGKGAVLTAAAPIHALAGAADFVRDSANAAPNGMKPVAQQPANTLNDIRTGLNKVGPIVKQAASSFGDKLKSLVPDTAVAAPTPVVGTQPVSQTPTALPGAQAAPVTNVKPVASQPAQTASAPQAPAQTATQSAPTKSTRSVDANGVDTISGPGYSISSENPAGILNPNREGPRPKSTPESLSALDKTIAYNARPETKEMFAREAAIVDARYADAKARRQGNQQQDLENLALNGGANGSMSFSQAAEANRRQKAAAGILALRNDATQNAQRNSIAERGLDITDRNTQEQAKQNASERDDLKSWREQTSKREADKLNRPKLMEIEEPVPGSTLGETRKVIKAFDPRTGEDITARLAQINSRTANAKKALEDPATTAEQKALAQEWLDNNPQD